MGILWKAAILANKLWDETTKIINWKADNKSPHGTHSPKIQNPLNSIPNIYRKHTNERTKYRDGVDVNHNQSLPKKKRGKGFGEIIVDNTITKWKQTMVKLESTKERKGQANWRRTGLGLQNFIMFCMFYISTILTRPGRRRECETQRWGAKNSRRTHKT